MNAMGTQTIIKTRVTFVFRGYGDLTLTDAALVWNKSATSYFAFGILNAITDDHILIPLESIRNIEKYAYLPGGGLKIINNEGKEFKFSFKHSRDFTIIWNYLKQIQSNTQQFKTFTSSPRKVQQKNFCPYCGGKVLYENAQFCSACGKEL